MAEPVMLRGTANAGLLVEYAGVRLLVDGIRREAFPPFLPTPDDVWDEMLRGAESSPWRNVDFLYFSHLHPDHYDARAVAEYLAHNRVRAVFAPKWHLPLKPDCALHCLAPQNGETADFYLAPGVSLRLIGTAHAGEPYRDIRNNACLLTLGEKRLLLTGDGDYEPDWYRPAGQADAIFVNPLFLNSRAMAPLVEQCQPQTVWLYHLTENGDDRERSFYWRVAARAEKRFAPGLVRYFAQGARAEM